MSIPTSTFNPAFLESVVLPLYQTYLDKPLRDATFLQVESCVFDLAMALGKELIDLHLQRQGTGDQGPTIDTAQGTLQRSPQPKRRRLRTIFGEHWFTQYAYGFNLDRKIDLLPIDARLSLHPSEFSPLFESYMTVLSVDKSFHATAKALQMLFRQKVAVHTLERLNQRLGVEAEDYLHELPQPDPKAEGKILILTGDGKGIPMVKPSETPLLAFEKRVHPGNRQMATLACVYTINPHYRNKTQVIEAIFRPKRQLEESTRPQPVGKAVVGFLEKVAPIPDDTIGGDTQAFTWASMEIDKRIKRKQDVIRLMDGQPSLWNSSRDCLDTLDRNVKTIDILDLIHVLERLWEAADLFETEREAREQQTERWLDQLLSGGVLDWIDQLQQRGQQLPQAAQEKLQKSINYFTNNQDRMKYDVYLQQGYPIATGVIEGACRHLVKDRMCRSGMRWKYAGAQAMLHLRAISNIDQLDDFNNYRIQQYRLKLHTYRDFAILAA